jgi:transcriptional regulator with XRE-family HTH domain
MAKTRAKIIDPAKLRRLRILANLDQPQLAERAGYSRFHITNIELGLRGVSVDGLHRLARAIGCDVEDLMPADDEPVEA